MQVAPFRLSWISDRRVPKAEGLSVIQEGKRGENDKDVGEEELKTLEVSKGLLALGVGCDSKVKGV